MDLMKNDSPEIYDKLARIYDQLFICLVPGHRRVGKYLQKEGIKNVLEVGVGTGLTFKHYAPGTELTGIDMSEGMLRLARKKVEKFPQTQIQLEQMDAQNLTFEDDSFECTYAPSLLSVVPDPQRLLQEMIRVTKPGGKIIIISHFQNQGAVDALFSKISTPLTLKLFGFRTDLPHKLIDEVTGVELLDRRKVNRVGAHHLSHLIILEKKALH